MHDEDPIIHRCNPAIKKYEWSPEQVLLSGCPDPDSDLDVRTYETPDPNGRLCDSHLSPREVVPAKQLREFGKGPLFDLDAEAAASKKKARKVTAPGLLPSYSSKKNAKAG